MSFNKAKYDTCTYQNELNRNVGILQYILDVNNYENNKKCRHEFGWLAGNNVSHIKGSLVDLESELRNQTRYVSKCCNSVAPPISSNNNITNDKTNPIDINKLHLNGCQAVPYASVSLPYANYINNTRCSM